MILFMATVAIGGLFILMSWLATPQTAPLISQAIPTQANLLKPTATPAPLKQPDTNAINKDVVATVNGETITDQAWHEATRLDAVMSQLANQPLPTAEETLDRLINEIIVLKAVKIVPQFTNREVEERIAALQNNWQVTDQEVITALAKTGLPRTDLTRRVNRLLQVETALAELATQKGESLNDWLAQTRATAEIGLYQALASDSLNPTVATPTLDSPAPLSKPAPPTDMASAPYPQNVSPDFSLPKLNGAGTVTLSDLRGKPTLLNFWATWCPPCRRELPALQAAYTKYGDRVNFVAVDVKEDANSVAAFATELGLTFPIVLDQDGQLSEAKYEIRGFPTTLFIDERGVVAVRQLGPVDAGLIDSYLSPLLEQAPQITISPTLELPLAPPFTLTAADGQTVSLQDYHGKSNVVLVFYRGFT